VRPPLTPAAHDPHQRLPVTRILRHGIGKELLGRAEALAAAEGAELLWITAWTGNAPALRFYEAQGYRDAGGSVYLFEGNRYETRVFVKKLHRTNRHEGCDAT